MTDTGYRSTVTPEAHRGVGTKLLIYTTIEGGDVQILTDFVDERGFLEIIDRGWFAVRFGDTMTRIYPAYVAFAVVLDGYDFRLENVLTNRGQQGRPDPNEAIGTGRRMV